ncbi:MAG TPA: hypothetical protein VH092_29130 [Urbifossiella sp.]|nr:hypothetical protein [Urbifossiella sp.]
MSDLAADGGVLPYRMKPALRGLRTLRHLTPAAYLRAGGIAGRVEPDHVLHPGVVRAAVVNPFDTIPTTTSLAGMPVLSRYRRSAWTGGCPVPGLAVRLHHENVCLRPSRQGVKHRQGAVGG